MGYAYCLGLCCNCRKSFTFNPIKVPSIRVNGEKEPVCEPCVRRYNALRAAQNLPTFNIPEGAYEACKESELG